MHREYALFQVFYICRMKICCQNTSQEDPDDWDSNVRYYSKNSSKRITFLHIEISILNQSYLSDRGY